MLEAIPTNLFARNFRILVEQKLIGEVDASLWRERARLELQDGTYELFREGTFGGDFFLTRDGKVVARATKPSAFRSTFDVGINGQHVVLRKLSAFKRRFGVFQDGRQIGSIYPQGIITRRSTIDLPAEWPLSGRVFLFWLVYLMWKRQEAAS